MSKTTKIILAISGGAVVGGLGVAASIYPQWGAIFAAASALTAMITAAMTGFTITK